jgi:DNA-binding CsgD family transcriptional regulator
MKVSLARFSEAVARIHEAATVPQRWDAALQAIVSVVDGSRAALLEIDAAGRLRGISQVGHDPATAQAYARDFYAIDPTRELALLSPAQKAVTSYQQFPSSFRRRHAYFDFARHVDIGDVVGLNCPDVSGGKAILGVQRSVRAKAYGEEEKRLLELIGRHLAIARKVNMRLGEGWSAAAEIQSGFARLSVPAFIVDASAFVRHANPAAESLVGRSRKFVVRGGRLRAADASAESQLQRAVRTAAAQPGRACAFAVHLDGGRVATVLTAPLAADPKVAAHWRDPLALVLVDAGEVDPQSIAWRMRQIYGLTPAEARVAALVALGQTVEEIALSMQVKRPTLRTHLRNIFGKTGTRRQAELVGLALRGAGIRID